ncbi:MAG: hypothetical protein ACRCWF_05910 [Beijerinckiaceae bacterium]
MPDLIRLYRGLQRRYARSFGNLSDKVAYDAFDRPQFAYGIYHAALQAKALGLNGFSVIEFGVAGGSGLVAMEAIAETIGAATDLTIDVYGFDTGEGQPPPVDYRDAPFIWTSGQFRMDQNKLKAQLKRATLVIGDVKHSAKTFMEIYNPKPIGFISFDMDYYSSTVDAFHLFNAGHAAFLPRAFCYFDDLVGDDHELHCEWTGELLAINEFNAAHPMMKLAPVHGLALKRAIPDHWHIKTYVLHRFEHPSYSTFINPKGDWQLPLVTRQGQ